MSYAIKPTGNTERPEEVAVVDLDTDTTVAVGVLEAGFLTGLRTGDHVSCDVRFTGTAVEG